MHTLENKPLKYKKIRLQDSEEQKNQSMVYQKVTFTYDSNTPL